MGLAGDGFGALHVGTTGGKIFGTVFEQTADSIGLDFPVVLQPVNRIGINESLVLAGLTPGQASRARREIEGFAVPMKHRLTIDALGNPLERRPLRLGPIVDHVKPTDFALPVGVDPRP